MNPLKDMTGLFLAAKNAVHVKPSRMTETVDIEILISILLEGRKDESSAIHRLPLEVIATVLKVGSTNEEKASVLEWFRPTSRMQINEILNPWKRKSTTAGNHVISNQILPNAPLKKMGMHDEESSDSWSED